MFNVRFFQRINDVIFRLMIPLVVLALVLGFVEVAVDLYKAFGASSIEETFTTVVTNVLSMFIVLELFKSIIEYFEIRRIRIMSILDAGLVFMVREIMIVVYHHKAEPIELAVYALALLAIAIARTLTVIWNPNYFYREKGLEDPPPAER